MKKVTGVNLMDSFMKKPLDSNSSSQSCSAIQLLVLQVLTDCVKLQKHIIPRFKSL
jgi:hypothetical protein